MPLGAIYYFRYNLKLKCQKQKIIRSPTPTYKPGSCPRSKAASRKTSPSCCSRPGRGRSARRKSRWTRPEASSFPKATLCRVSFLSKGLFLQQRKKVQSRSRKCKRMAVSATRSMVSLKLAKESILLVAQSRKRRLRFARTARFAGLHSNPISCPETSLCCRSSDPQN